ncbi:MAG: HypC/HybG/HupF family hydrogenase formation chaperone [Candidatus Methanomethylicia archaeon]
MCLAIPAKIISINGDKALADFGGVQKEIIITLVKERIKVNDYVLVHAGFAIQILDEESLNDIINVWNELLKVKLLK